MTKRRSLVRLPSPPPAPAPVPVLSRAERKAVDEFFAKLPPRRRRHAFLLRLSDDEARRLDELAAKTGLSLSNAARHAICAAHLAHVEGPMRQQAEVETVIALANVIGKEVDLAKEAMLATVRHRAETEPKPKPKRKSKPKSSRGYP